MNERIRQLAEQAGMVIVDDEFSTYGKFAEKFAELIVQECVGIVEGIEPGYKDYRDQIEDSFRRDCVTGINEHFGVEE